MKMLLAMSMIFIGGFLIGQATCEMKDPRAKDAVMFDSPQQLPLPKGNQNIGELPNWPFDPELRVAKNCYFFGKQMFCKGD